jgi:hypothetical protein
MTRLSTESVTQIERQLGIVLPPLYRTILIERGFGSYGQRANCALNTTREIYHPESVTELYGSFFDDPSMLYAPYFPFGCNNETQDLWIIDAARGLAASICHETVPDDWPDAEWISYDNWLARFFDLGASL